MTKQLIEENMKLVYHIIYKFYPNYANDEDIVQAGMLGLCKAAGLWDESKGAFSTIAGKCILNEITNEFRRRKKHYGVLSLDYEVDGLEGEPIPYGELLVGTEDVDFVDIEPLYSGLSDVERRIVDMRRRGMNNKEIASTIGCGVRTVQRKLRKVKFLWDALDE